MAEHSYTVPDRVLSEWGAAIRRRLEVEAAPLNAKSLAATCGIKGAHETLRRRIREAVTFAREGTGLRICANSSGYWLARDASEWKSYLQAVALGARFKFVKLAKTKAAVTDRMNRQEKFDFAGLRN